MASGLIRRDDLVVFLEKNRKAVLFFSFSLSPFSEFIFYFVGEDSRDKGRRRESCLVPIGHGSSHQQVAVRSVGLRV